MSSRPRSLFAAVPAVAARAGVASPCVSVCRMDAASGLCEGCFRTIDEIAHWGLFDDGEKQAVLDQLPARRTAAQGAR
jgi:predicted Fe-S protein YdhL (DUF1289 family)